MSTLRRFRNFKTETKLVNIGGSVAFDLCGDSNYRTIPWKVENQTLDIETDETVLGTTRAREVAEFIQFPIDLSETYPYGLTTIRDETPDMFVIQGGYYVINDIGDNLKTLIENSLANVSGGETVDANSIEIKGTGLMGICREVDNTFAAPSDVYKITNDPPTLNYVFGDADNNFRRNYFFRKPLYVKYSSSGVEKIVQFRSTINDRD